MKQLSRVAISLVLVVATFLAAACDNRLLDRTIVAIDNAPVLVATFNISDAEKQNLNAKFAAVSSALKAYVASKDQNKWNAFLTSFDALVATGAVIKDENARKRINAITFLVRVLFGFSSSDTRTGARGAAPPAQPNLDKIRSSDVKKLEELMKP